MGKKFVTMIVGVLVTVPVTVFSQSLDETFVVFTIDGRSRTVVTDPGGDRVGSHGFSVWNESDNAEQDLLFERQNITYTNPQAGNYQFDFAGQYTEDFVLRLGYYDGTHYSETDMRRWNESGTTTKMTINLDITDQGFVFDSPEVQPLRGRAIKNEQSTDLSWNRVDGAAGYRVYYKIWDYPYFGLLVETPSTTAATNIAWARDSGDPLRPTGLYYFVVTAVLDNGNETVFSPIFTNADQDGDGYNDFREAQLGTDPNQTDTDGDGIDDFAEQNQYYTSPTNPDSDGDGHRDGDEVTAGTLPNQAESYPGRVNECMAPESGDWHVSEHCTVIAEQDIPADLIVHPNSVLTVRERITMWFDYTRHKILVMFGAGLHLEPGASIKQK